MPDNKKAKKLQEITDEGEVVSAPAPVKSSLSGFTEIPDDEIASPSLNQNELAGKISAKESQGEYSATNPNSTATGKYQFLWGNKPGEGFGDTIKKVTGVKSQQEFLNNPQAQEKFFQYHLENNLKPAAARLSAYNKQGYSDSQLAMLAHFKGEEGAKQYLQSGIDNTQRHNSSIDDYIGAPENAQPQSTSTNAIPSSIAAPQQPKLQGLTELDPITNLPKPEAPVNEKQQVADKTNNAVQVISKDLLDNFDNHHPQDQQNIASIPLHEPGNLLHDITNPHGNPELTSNYLKDRTAQLQQQRAQEINAAGFNDPFKAAGANPQTLTDINNNYDQKADQIKQSANHLLELQLFNKEYTDKKYTQAEATTAKDAAEKQRQDAIKAANEHLSEKVKGVDKYDTDKATSEFHAEVRNINEGYGKSIAEINSGTKYDDVKMGLEHARLSGDPKAEQDYERYNSGKALSPEDKLKYQLQGQQIISTGTSASANENVTKEGQAHIKTSGQIESENQQAFNDRRAQQIGNAKYNDEKWYNALGRAVAPHFGSMSQEDVNKYGKQVGLTDAQIKKIDPENVPTQSTIWAQFAKGALNTAAPIYERAVRSAAVMAGSNPEDVNEVFKPGWENQKGLGAAIVGNMPSDQNTFHNVRGAIGQMMEGFGGLSTFGGEIGLAAKGLETAGATVEAAHKLANFGIMAFNGYNNAYHDANEVIGDKPEDEWKRQAYAATLGVIEGKIFSINPKAELFNRAIGIEKEGGLVGKDFLNEIKNAKDASFFEQPSTLSKIANTIKETAKEDGIQVSLATANELAKQTVNTIVNPQKKQDIADDLKNTAASTALAMFIPSLFAGVNHAMSQNPLMKASMFDIGTQPQKYSQLVDEQLANKSITPEQATQSKEAIGTMKSIIDNTPAVDAKGQPLTPDQIKDYAWNLLRQHTLQGKVDQITGQASQSNIAPDKAQVDPINKEISELEGERTKIISGKGAKRLPTPVPEKVEETPQAERSVAKDEEIPNGEKKENISPIENEKDISLQSQIITEKNNDHGNSIEENNGRQSNTEANQSEDQRQDADIRKAAHSSRGHEQEKDRVLSTGEEPEGNREPQAEKEQPAAIPVKEKKNRFAKIEEKTPVVAEEAKPEETQSQPETKTESDATIHSEEQKQEVHPEGGEQEHAPVEPARGEAEAASTENSDSHISGKAEEEVVPTPAKENVPRETEPTTPVADAESTQEKPTEEKPDERSVATEADKVPESDQQKSPLSSAVDNFNKYKDAVIKKEAALQKLHDEGKRKGDESYDKKVAELEQAKNKKLEAFKEYEKEFRKSGKHNDQSLSKAIRKKTEKIAKKAEKNQIKGAKAGFGPSDADWVRMIGNSVANLVELGENIHLAIRKVLDEFRGQLSKDQEQELKNTLQQGEHVEKYRDNLKHEPPFLAHKEDHDIAVDLIKEIKAGNDTLEDVMDDLHDANISPERKKVIADFIDREINLTNEQKENAKDQYVSTTLREPEHEQSYLKDFPLKKSDKISSYFSHDTISDVTGEEAQFARDSKTQLEINAVVENMADIVGVAKMHSGNDVMDYGTDLLGHIKSIAGSDGTNAMTRDETHKVLMAAEALSNELHGERIRLTEELKTATPERKNEINDRLRKIQSMTKQTDILYRDITSHASDILNAARANRRYRDKFMGEEYASRILSDKQRKEKEAMESALDTTKISDKEAEQGTAIPEEKAKKEVKDTIEEKNKSKEGKNVESDIKEPKKKEDAEKKAKSLIDRLKEKAKKKEEKKDNSPRIVDMGKEAKDRMGGKTPEEFLNQLKEKIKKKKC